MDQVFAPWRIEWVEREDRNADVDHCVFCEYPERGADREHLVVARSEHAVVMLNNYPYNPGHVMVIPRVHESDYANLSREILTDHAVLKQRTFRALDAAFDPDGYNAGLNLGGSAAGGSLAEHLHTHVVPRWTGDTNFMPTLADTKVIVEALDDSYDRLHEAYAALEGANVADQETAVRF
jgi:ATP adenylyltransferase